MFENVPTNERQYYNLGAKKNKVKNDVGQALDYATITRRSQGNDATIGDLYDAIRDKYNDVNIFGDNINSIPADAIKIKKLGEEHTPIIEANCFKDKITLLHIENELIVRIFFRLKIDFRSAL